MPLIKRFAGFVHRIQLPRILTVSEMQANGLYILKTPRNFGEVALIDQNGNPFTRERFLDKWTLVFFGFTYCPDVCPATLIHIAGWLEEIENRSRRLNAIFITVDPERDTPKVLAEYVTNFHPAIRGWTGSPDQIRRAAEGFRASFEKVSTGSDGYLMNHTASVFLFTSNGRFISTIDAHEPKEFAIPKILRALESDQNQK